MTSIATNGSIIVAVCANNIANNIYTSINGTTWTTRSIPANYFQKVIWAQELSLFCIVGAFQVPRIATSPDGITWTTRSAPTYNLRDVTYSERLNLLVAVGNDGSGSTVPQIATSSNGISWTTRFTGIFPFELGLVSVIKGTYTDRFVGLGGPRSMAIYSDDGITWLTSTISTGTLQRWTTMKYIDDMGVLLAVSNNDFALGTTTNVIKEAYTTDGITWTTAATIPTISAMTSPYLSCGLGYFKEEKMLGFVSSNRSARWKMPNTWYAIAYSPIDNMTLINTYDPVNTTQKTIDDGLTWTTSISAFRDNLNYQKELDLFITKTNNSALYSSDGVTWTSSTMPNIYSKKTVWNKTLSKLTTLDYNTAIRLASSNVTWTSVTYPKEVSLGTSIISNTTISGKTIDMGEGSTLIAIGDNASDVRFGDNATTVKVGNIFSTIDINGGPYKKYIFSAYCNNIPISFVGGTSQAGGYANWIDNFTGEDIGTSITMPKRGIYSIDSVVCGATDLDFNATIEVRMYLNNTVITYTSDSLLANGASKKYLFPLKRIVKANEGDTIRIYMYSNNGNPAFEPDDDWQTTATYLDIQLLEYS